MPFFPPSDPLWGTNFEARLDPMTILDAPEEAKLAYFKPLIRAVAAQYNLEPSLLAGLCSVESGFDQYAIRVERGFWRRYMKGILAFVNRTPGRVDNHWSKYPDLYASSYGLTQPMLQTALENGWKMHRFPTELMDPRTNLSVGAKILRRFIDRSGGDLRRGLLRYNGGGDPRYPDKVLRRQAWAKRQGL